MWRGGGKMSFEFCKENKSLMMTNLRVMVVGGKEEDFVENE